MSRVARCHRSSNSAEAPTALGVVPSAPNAATSSGRSLKTAPPTASWTRPAWPRLSSSSRIFATFLADDYFFKYPFTRDAFIAMGAFFGAAFFSDVPEESPVSRFRLTMRMFDLIRENMRALPGYEQQARALSVKNSRDLLDTDIEQNDPSNRSIFSN